MTSRAMYFTIFIKDPNIIRNRHIVYYTAGMVGIISSSNLAGFCHNTESCCESLHKRHYMIYQIMSTLEKHKFVYVIGSKKSDLLTTRNKIIKMGNVKYKT